MGRNKITLEDFIIKLNKINPDLEILNNSFIGLNEKIEIKCNKCNYIWKPCARKLIEKNPNHCPKCSKNKFKMKNFNERVLNMYNGEYVVKGNYINNHTLIKMLHTICNNEYYVSPSNFLGTPNKKPRKCPYCSGLMKKDTEWFKLKVKEKVNEEYKVIGEYKTTHDPIKMLHTICNNEYYVSPSNFLNLNKPQRCPFCNSTESKGEKRIKEYLEKLEIDFEQHYSHPLFKGNKNHYNFDFKVNYTDGSYKLIEFFGELHYRPFSGKQDEKFLKQQERDKIKINLCKSNNIPLLVISYKDFSKIDELLNTFLFEE